MATIYDLKKGCRFVQTNDGNYPQYFEGAILDIAKQVYYKLSPSATVLVKAMLPDGATKQQLIHAAKASYPDEKDVDNKVNKFLTDPVATANFLISNEPPPRESGETDGPSQPPPPPKEMSDPTVSPEAGVDKSVFSVTGYIGLPIIGSKY